MKLKNWLLTVTLLTSPLAYGQYCGTDVGSINTPNNHFSLLNNGTVVHKKTGLTWSRCLVGQSWANGQCQGKPASLDHAQAALEAKNSSLAGKSAWRLPTKQEIATIVETACEEPSANLDVFPTTPSAFFWTGEKVADEKAWMQYFGNGRSFRMSIETLGKVRLVHK